jgi:hypothetical protein
MAGLQARRFTRGKNGRMEGWGKRKEWQDGRDTKEKNDRMDVKAAKRADMLMGKIIKRDDRIADWTGYQLKGWPDGGVREQKGMAGWTGHKRKNDRMDVKAAKRVDKAWEKHKKRWQDGRLDGSPAKRMTGSM